MVSAPTAIHVCVSCWEAPAALHGHDPVQGGADIILNRTAEVKKKKKGYVKVVSCDAGQLFSLV